MLSIRREKGFTMIELMLVVVVIAILAAIALPSFLDQVRKARRSDAKQPLMDEAAKLEQYYQDNKGYSGYTVSSGISPEEYYTISFFAGPTTTAYTIQAVPRGDQTKDKTCQTFRLNNLGQKTVTKGNAKDCW